MKYNTPRLMVSLIGIVLAVTAVLIFSSAYGLFSLEQLLSLLTLITILEVLVSPPVAERLPEPLRTSLAFGFVGASVSAGFMLLGTFVLGHVRAVWMEFNNAMPAAAAGLIVGAICGIPVAWIRKQRQ